MAAHVAAALSQGGAHTLEFTNRGEFALQTFSDLVRYLSKAAPSIIIGVGTIEDAHTAALFIAHGANFVVAPNFNPEVARLCNRRKIAYIPGVATVSEIAAAEEYGAEIVKMFPAESVGGPGFIKGVLAPRPWSRIMPSGGVMTDEDNLRAWLDAGAACVGMGSQLIRSAWLQAENYEAIAQETSAVLTRIRQIRNR